MQKKQATGIDTRMMMPAYGCIFALFVTWCMPWIQIPSLRFAKFPTAYRVFASRSCVENIQAGILSGRGFAMEPLSTEELLLFTGIGAAMEIAALVMTVMFVICTFLVFTRKGKSLPFVRVTYGMQLTVSLIVGISVFCANCFLNSRMGIPNQFLNLTLNSSVKLTSWVYGQILISGILLFGAPRLMDVNREVGPPKYVERTMKKDTGMKIRTKVTLVLITAAIPLVILFGIFFLNDRSNVFIGLIIICLAMVPFAMVFEGRQPQARELLLIAVISAIAVVGRSAFFMLPQFKPVTAIVIIAGIGLGPEAGFLTGAASGFVSNFFFGQGPWTPWQMFAYGIIGFISGLIFSRRSTNKIRSKWGERAYMGALCIYGALATFFIYGFLMDFSSALNFTQEFSWKVLLAKLISGASFNLIHAVSTVVFLLLLARPFQRKLDRIKKKYGIMEA